MDCDFTVTFKKAWLAFAWLAIARLLILVCENPFGVFQLIRMKGEKKKKKKKNRTREKNYRAA